MRRPAVFFALLALLMTAHGLLPGRILAPADLPRDLDAWKPDPALRVRVSNSLLSDVALQFIPWDAEVVRHLERREVPWRNQYASAGAPLFANPQTALFSPFTWPRIAIGLRGWGWTVFLKIFVAGLSMYWLARVCRFDERMALVSGSVYALCGFATVWALHPHTNVFAVLPALCASALATSRDPSRSNVARSFVFAALATAGGHPETLFIGVVAIGILLLVNRERLGTFLTAAAAGFLLLGVQLVPFAMILARSHVIQARDAIQNVHLRKLSPVALLLPGYLGSPLRGELDLTGAIPLAENFHQRNAGYVGALVLLATIASLRRVPPLVRRGILIGTAALLISWCLPVIGRAMHLVPIVRWVAFEYYPIAFALFVALASGAALMQFPLGRSRLAWAVLGFGLALIAGGLVPFFFPAFVERLAHHGLTYLRGVGLLHQPESVYDARLAYYLGAAQWTALRRIAIPGFCFALFGAGTLMRRRGLIAAAALAELIGFGWGYVPSIPVEDIAPAPRVVEEIRRAGKGGYVAASNEVFPPNLATLYGVRDVHSYDVLTSEAETRRLMEGGFDPVTGSFSANPSAEQIAALSRLGVRWYLSRTPVPGATRTGGGLPPAAGIYELPNAAPPPPASNAPPDSLLAGSLTSLAGLVLFASLLLLPLDRARRLG